MFRKMSKMKIEPTISKSEYRAFSAIGVSAGQVSFGSLFASVFGRDSIRLFPMVFSLFLTAMFLGMSWLLARRYHV